MKKTKYVEFYDLCSRTNIIRVIKSRRMRWAGHVARMREKTDACSVLVERPEGNKYARIILKLSLQDVGVESMD
jgi:hypothetical protein